MLCPFLRIEMTAIDVTFKSKLFVIIIINCRLFSFEYFFAKIQNVLKRIKYINTQFNTPNFKQTGRSCGSHLNLK